MGREFEICKLCNFKGEQINDIWELQNCFLSTMHGKIKKNHCNTFPLPRWL